MFASKKMQRQITKRYHFKLIKLATNFLKSEISKYCPRCGENVNSLLLLMKVWLNIAGGEQFVVFQYNHICADSDSFLTGLAL